MTKRRGSTLDMPGVKFERRYRRPGIRAVWGKQRAKWDPTIERHVITIATNGGRTCLFPNDCAFPKCQCP